MVCIIFICGGYVLEGNMQRALMVQKNFENLFVFSCEIDLTGTGEVQFGLFVSTRYSPIEEFSIGDGTIKLKSLIRKMEVDNKGIRFGSGAILHRSALIVMTDEAIKFIYGEFEPLSLFMATDGYNRVMSNTYEGAEKLLKELRLIGNLSYVDKIYYKAQGYLIGGLSNYSYVYIR